VLATVGGILVFVVGFAIGRRVEDRDGRGTGRFNDFAHRDDPGRGVGLLVLLLLVALVIAGVVLLVRRVGARRDGPGHEAERVLAERFARGEIDDDEFARRRNALRS
jgi:putative membrane protein